MNILIACEESQVVTKEFRHKGHNAFSCDILEPSGEHIEWHTQGDVSKLINGKCTFETMDGKTHKIEGKWDMIIAFPPCTHLAVSGARHFEEKRKDGRQREAIEFFIQFINADCDKIVVENPVNIISGKYIGKHYPDLVEKYKLPIKPTQYIQPYEFGHSVTKKTALWIKGVEPLTPTNIVDKGEIITFASGKKMHKFFATSYGDGSKRSKTFEGIAKAMGEQWG